MNQTQKRLSIIKLAISIGDTETIQLQILKLAPLHNDARIQEIIQGLQAENYAQTQTLITEYIETPPEEIHQRTEIQEQPLTEEEAEEIIEAFDLFKVEPTPTEEKVEEILDLDPYTTPPSPSTKQPDKVDYSELLHLKSDEVLTENIDIAKTTLTPEDDFFDKETDISDDLTTVIEKDDFFHTGEEEKIMQATDETISLTEAEIEGISVTEAPILNEESPIEAQESDRYEPIPYIDQKLKNMMTQYPPVEMPESSYPSADAWLIQIANEGYTEQEIEAIMQKVHDLTQAAQKGEAAQLLLISAATHSTFAQFMLARALFKGDILLQNLPESFTLINRLAMDDDYPEAICDLGQLYEYGVGIDRDRKRAEALYKEAMERGIKRAKAHYERLYKQNRGLFSFLKK